MITLLTEPPEEIQRFRTGPWPFQCTFKTPLKDLARFVSHFVAPFSFETGVLSTDEVVFAPKNLQQLLTENSLQASNVYRLTIQAAGERDIAGLLQAALADWVDFVFVPSPQVVAMYADHDEYTTFYAREDETLRNVVLNLEGAAFEPVLNYTRGGVGDGWR